LKNDVLCFRPAKEIEEAFSVLFYDLVKNNESNNIICMLGNKRVENIDTSSP
jgi:hypothetical protein